jgi:DNA-binding transcriptional MerR regulator/quercetin dioxygenase-like cupin family protein
MTKPNVARKPANSSKNSRRSQKIEGKPETWLKVGQAARVLGISTSTLRLWENVGLITPERTKGGFRLYRPDMIARLQRIKQLRAVEHLNIHGIKKMLDDEPGNNTKPSKNIGSSLRLLRHHKKMSLSEAAKRAGITVGYLSAIERSLVDAPYRAIQKLAAVYGTSVLGLHHPPGRRGRLVRSEDGRFISVFPGYRLELLSAGARELECIIFQIEPGAGSHQSFAHEGEEFVYILSGKLEIRLEETEKHVLSKGDSIWYNSNRRHRWLNPSKKRSARALWVVASAKT